MRPDERLVVDGGDEPDRVPRCTEALPEGDVRLNVASAARGQDGDLHEADRSDGDSSLQLAVALQAEPHVIRTTLTYVSLNVSYALAHREFDPTGDERE